MLHEVRVNECFGIRHSLLAHPVVKVLNWCHMKEAGDKFPGKEKQTGCLGYFFYVKRIYFHTYANA